MEKVIFVPMNDKSFSEIGQYVPYRFAFSSPTFEQAHPFVYCRDFLNDAIRAAHLKEKSPYVYGFSYDPDDSPVIGLDKIRMIVENIDETQVTAALKIIHLFESDNRLPKTTSFATQNNNVHIFVGPKAWTLSPFSVSLYTFLIRLGYNAFEFETKDEFIKCCNNYLKKGKNDHDDHDHEYLKSTKDYLFKIFKERKIHSLKNNNGYKNLEIHAFHNHSGIVSLVKLSLYDEKLKQQVKEHIIGQ